MSLSFDDPILAAVDQSNKSHMVDVECITLEDVMVTTNEHRTLPNHPVYGTPIIDILSVDTEGSEFAIFFQFNFSQWTIYVIIVEMFHFTASRALEDIFFAAGFFEVAIIGGARIFVHRDLYTKRDLY